MAKRVGPTTELEHGTLTGYRAHHCRCERCLAAQADYMRAYRRSRRGLEESPVKKSAKSSSGASVAVLPGARPAPPEGIGPNEQGVIDRCAGLTAAPDHPEWVAAARALAAIMDDKRQITSQPSAARQLLATMDKIEAASVLGRKNRLASVASMSRSSSASAG